MKKFYRFIYFFLFFRAVLSDSSLIDIKTMLIGLPEKTSSAATVSLNVAWFFIASVFLLRLRHKVAASRRFS